MVEDYDQVPSETLARFVLGDVDATPRELALADRLIDALAELDALCRRISELEARLG